ncbi:hypothetical protein RchiOBHm_Chr5g0025971 [Rosa chinensis]|uniref:Uncharacterized protein n=1 Tax=Rosa chinensis TaxID=74649 RepID=A0A2P6Q8S0_ROSCH|nr:hypothetical protein RchiOBHm_Chr5g0025971 [Rosa chinensis]
MMTCYLKHARDPSVTAYLDIVERAFNNRSWIIASLFLNKELYLVALQAEIAESDKIGIIY